MRRKNDEFWFVLLWFIPHRRQRLADPGDASGEGSSRLGRSLALPVFEVLLRNFLDGHDVVPRAGEGHGHQHYAIAALEAAGFLPPFGRLRH